VTPEQKSCHSYTIAHFQEIARQNRFAENSTIEHDVERCAVCHPELLPVSPFAVYLDVVTQSIKVRRPRVDQSLVDEINSDLILSGLDHRMSPGLLLSGEDQAERYWEEWIREAFETGLGLLSVHSRTSFEFSLEEAEAEGFADLIDERVQELKKYQRDNAQRA
jgi:hypothetical protein